MSDKLSTEVMEKLHRWHTVAAEAKRIGAEEMQLRKELAAELVPTGEVGTKRFPIANGFNAKVVIGQSIKLANDASDKLPEVYSKLVAAGLAADFAAGLIKSKQELHESSYKKLSPELQLIMADIVVVKPSAPTLEIEAPKEGGK